MTKVKIIALPFAGGNGYSYNRFKPFFPSNFDLLQVELPGRGERLDENNVSDIVKLAKDVFRQIEKDVRTHPYLIYGHSMGTLLGYELTKEIVKQKYPQPSCLFFTGRASPCFGEEDRITSYPTDIFWKEIRMLGGVPKEVLANKELLDFFEPVLRSDIKAVEDYQYVPMQNKFKIPLYVFAGSEELDITREKLAAWQDESTYPLHMKFIQGDHFFIFEHCARIVEMIVTAHKESSKSLHNVAQNS